MHNEDRFLRECEDKLKVLHPGLAYQVLQKQNICGCFTLKHLKCLGDLAGLASFSGTLVPGESMKTALGESASHASVHIPTQMLRDSTMSTADSLSGINDLETQKDLEDEEDVDDMAEVVSCAFDDILHIAEDSGCILPQAPKD